MELEPVKSIRIYEDIVRQVKALIADGRLTSGDRLPTNNGTGCYFLPPVAPQDTSTCQTPSGGAFNYNCTQGSFGTANRRFFHGPAFNNTDFGLTKRTVIRESMAFEIRAEFFNIFNHPQFRNPSGDISGGSFGIVSSARDPRIGQVSAKFIW